MYTVEANGINFGTYTQAVLRPAAEARAENVSRALVGIEVEIRVDGRIVARYRAGVRIWLVNAQCA